jgi:hypothetical protein
MAGFAFYLNSKYYLYYFKDSGYPENMPFLMAIFFISSELILWSFSNQKNFVSILLKYGLVIFSILATLSSQFASTSERNSENERLVYEKIDNSGIIAEYQEEIKIQNDRINDIFTERKEKSYYGLTEDELKYAQEEKAKYEQKIEALRFENKAEIQEVFVVENMYHWMASDLPRIFKNGLNEEFIRVIFQLFSSLILAAIAPVCISLIRTFKFEHKKQSGKFKHKKIMLPKIRLPKIKLPKIKLPAIKKIPSPVPEPEPLKRTSISNIVKMLLTGENGLLSPEIASKEFTKIKDCKSRGLMYCIDECRQVYDFIVSHGLENKNKDEILERWINENNRNRNCTDFKAKFFKKYKYRNE